jgi:hypothetical protein
MRRIAWHTAVILAAAVSFGAPSAALAAVTLTASRAEVLYSADDNPDCSNLHDLQDAGLPLNVVRLSVLVDGQPPAPGTAIKWSYPDPAVGTLLADEALGPDDTSAGIVGFCAEFGNECTLTKEKLAFYTKPTILWLGPLCNTLPEKTARAFAGGSVKFRVKLRGLGKAKSAVGYGHLGSATLSMTALGGELQDGIGKPDGVLGPVNPGVSAVADSSGLPALEAFQFDSGAGEEIRIPPPCVGVCGQLKYPAADRYVATLTARLNDGSALCDRLVYRVATCEGTPKLEVITKPKRETYQDGQTVHLQVRLHNNSPRENGCAFLLQGDVLSCSAQLKVGGIEETHSGEFSYQSCSTTSGQACEVNSDCGCTTNNCPCPDCAPNEFCLDYDHCSETVQRHCVTDEDCESPACPECRENETCVDVIPKPREFLGVGQSIDLVDKDVVVKNVLPDTARIKETWTARTENAGGDTDDLNYRIRGTH